MAVAVEEVGVVEEGAGVEAEDEVVEEGDVVEEGEVRLFSYTSFTCNLCKWKWMMF